VRRLCLALVWLALAVTCACGPSPARAPGAEGAEVGLVVVVILPTPEKLPFDPRGARLRAATAELGGLVGHPVTFVIDAGLAAEGRASFDSQLIEAIEGVARDLAALKKHEAVAFAYGAPRLDKIVCHYRAVATTPTATFDEGQRTITVVDARRPYTLVGPGLVYHALAVAYEAAAEGRYSALAAREVPPAERRAYFEYLHAGRATAGDGTPLFDKRSFAILRVTELAGALGGSDPALAADVRTWLLGERSHFAQAYVFHPEDVQSLAPAFHAAEKAWTAWLTSIVPTMTAVEKLAVVRDLSLRGVRGTGYVTFAYPGFDKLGLMLSVVDGWIAAGHPDTFRNRTDDSALYQYVVCPHPKDADGHRGRSPNCEHDLYTLVVLDEAARKRFVTFLLARKDPVLTEAAFAAIVHAQAGQDALARWLLLAHAVEADEEAWGIGAGVLGEIADTSGPRLVDEARRLWAAYPSRRPALLAVLAAADPYDDGTVDWRGFTHDFGAPIDEPLLAATLEKSPVTVARLPTMWPALGAGWLRASAIVPRLDRFVDGVERQHGDRQLPFTTFRDLFNAMCTDGTPGAADVAALRTYLVDRARTHPGDALSSLESEANCHGRRTRPRSRRGGPHL
jgi:hypothetical protein